uniref:3-oxoacyl-[acyl-carrier-protein] reductase n=1 Tax=Nephromyces sp. MMRI TaxID=2496275 RepID=A0A3Q8UC80_9APIC|nr:peroxisomal trans-2-enoyl-CoA reductase [Nephromyces sp. MMRI]AZL94672.1 peroxisomal trans-2-enoyl-CoA reductase [Nephromyces sp. MMRI]
MPKISSSSSSWRICHYLMIFFLVEILSLASEWVEASGLNASPQSKILFPLREEPITSRDSFPYLSKTRLQSSYPAFISQLLLPATHSDLNKVGATASSASSASSGSSTAFSPSFQLTYTGSDPSSSASGKPPRPLVALVTGASRGIGKKVAETLARAGVSEIICVSKSQAACEATSNELKALPCKSSAYSCDVSDGDAVEALMKRIALEHANIDILINNAGITKDVLFMRMSRKDWEDVIKTNLNSAFYFSSAVMRGMMKRKFGRIINMSSVVGVGGNHGQANYAASKAGLIGFTKSLAREVGKLGITVNAVAPGFIISDMTDKMTEEAKAATLNTIPAGRLGLQEEVASLVAYLASDQAAYINGKVIPVDGGMLFGGS